MSPVQLLCDPTGVEGKRSVHIRATFARHGSTRFGKSALCLPGDIPVVSKIRDLNTALCCFAISPLVSLYRSHVVICNWETPGAIDDSC